MAFGRSGRGGAGIFIQSHPETVIRGITFPGDPLLFNASGHCFRPVGGPHRRRIPIEGRSVVGSGWGEAMAKASQAFRTISEVADDLGVPKHVLRFWEMKFPQIRPMKRGGGRRYYRPEDVELLRGIQVLLHSEGFTIRGVQKILRERGSDQVKASGEGGSLVAGLGASRETPAPRKRARAPIRTARNKATANATLRQIVEQAIGELEACRKLLKDAA
jgi:DNA-binding transcriptional MerR regulator